MLWPYSFVSGNSFRLFNSVGAEANLGMTQVKSVPFQAKRPSRIIAP
jgi:hypothetical protein